MSGSNDKEGIGREPMLDMFVFETQQLIEQLEQAILKCESSGEFDTSVHEIFRVMHTIKGNAAMLLFNNIAELAHAMEDLFYFIREQKPTQINASTLIDLVLEGVDFFKEETAKIENGTPVNGEPQALMKSIHSYLSALKEANPAQPGVKKAKAPKTAKPVEAMAEPESKYYISSSSGDNGDAGAQVAGSVSYEAVAFFEDCDGMEDLRAFSLMTNLKEIGTVVFYQPEDITENDDSVEWIRQHGFKIRLVSRLGVEEVQNFIRRTPFLRDLQLTTGSNFRGETHTEVREPSVEQPHIDLDIAATGEQPEKASVSVKENEHSQAKMNIISVNVQKLDALMNLVGELVVAESMVTHNPDLAGLSLENFQKAARQLHKITNELQDTVMSVRMVPLANTFQKMNRLVRDMSRKLDKQVKLELIGEETEVDKNIIEHLSDPLMHLIRNSLDHGLESPQERESKGKPAAGLITLEAKNAGGEVWVMVKDDGKGLNREQILKKAREKGLLDSLGKSENELTDKEVYSFIMLPGFSTKEAVTEYSGRGVGMDVVAKNITKIGGKIIVDSLPGQGTTVSLKIPLTLAIINGMTVQVGASRYTIPTTDIKESFRAQEKNLITDPEGHEMIMIRGECYPIIRLHRIYRVNSAVHELADGIMVMIENDSKSVCLFADALLGEQQVVVKPLPGYIKKINGIAGCTLLGEGNISLIIDASGLIA